mmetsp:Transcript_102277/g.218938  ORF Transcript_102277/g.218938 Transcript_102277/m.218938 type:complete len:335 (-) Transcript_102277:40-1044(-)
MPPKKGRSPAPASKGAAKSTAAATPAKIIIDTFAKFDRDSDGGIEEQELMRVLRKIEPRFSKDDCSRLFKGIDANGDGKIQYAEFVAWLFLDVPEQWQDSAAAIPNYLKMGLTGTRGPLKGGVLDRIVVSPYGVLGMQLTGAGEMVRNAPEPDSQIAIVDPAGLAFIQTEGPSLAGGAAGVIYQWLGIGEEPGFPEPVRSAIQAPLQAKFHNYGEKKCIHVVGPNFNREEYCSRQAAEVELGEAYRAALAEFSESGVHSLRLLPLSGGIFAGPFQDEMPELTAVAMQHGFLMLTGEQQQRIMSAERLEMCIFTEDEFPRFKESFARHASTHGRR